jgi:hypothetical protein
LVMLGLVTCLMMRSIILNAGVERTAHDIATAAPPGAASPWEAALPGHAAPGIAAGPPDPTTGSAAGTTPRVDAGGLKLPDAAVTAVPGGTSTEQASAPGQEPAAASQSTDSFASIAAADAADAAAAAEAAAGAAARPGADVSQPEPAKGGEDSVAEQAAEEPAAAGAETEQQPETPVSAACRAAPAFALLAAAWPVQSPGQACSPARRGAALGLGNACRSRAVMDATRSSIGCHLRFDSTPSHTHNQPMFVSQNNPAGGDCGADAGCLPVNG